MELRLRDFSQGKALLLEELSLPGVEKWVRTGLWHPGKTSVKGTGVFPMAPWPRQANATNSPDALLQLSTHGFRRADGQTPILQELSG